MTREKMLEKRKALEALVGPISDDDPSYDDKRAFILFGAKDPNATWESLRDKAPSADVQVKIDAQTKARVESTAWAIWNAEQAE